MEGGNTKNNIKSQVKVRFNILDTPFYTQRRNGGEGGGGVSLSRKFNLKDRTECRQVKHINLYSDLLK